MNNTFSQLASYAMDAAASRGRQYSDNPLQKYRNDYQRDRDRVIHSTAFRRLEYKTQVFIFNEGDYYRTRLTHTIEVSQIARTIAKALKLNEDLVEAIALAHDLGHTPFGHAGEDVLNDLMKDHGGFNHNLQSLRIVKHIEKRYPQFRGLNLTWEVQEGIAKHTTKYDTTIADKIQEYEPTKKPSLEAQVVDLADEIAYNNHDLDDGITSGLINEENLHKVTLWKEANDTIEKRYSNIPTKIKKFQQIRFLISYLIEDLITQSQNNIKEFNIASVDDVRNAAQKIISFSTPLTSKIKPLRKFLEENFYHHPRVVGMTQKAHRFIIDLFNAYIQKPDRLPHDFQKHIKSEGDEYRIVCDYIAGMTDRYALDEHKKLFAPYEKV